MDVLLYVRLFDLIAVPGTKLSAPVLQKLQTAHAVETVFYYYSVDARLVDAVVVDVVTSVCESGGCRIRMCVCVLVCTVFGCALFVRCNQDGQSAENTSHSLRLVVFRSRATYFNIRNNYHSFTCCTFGARVRIARKRKKERDTMFHDVGFRISWRELNVLTDEPPNHFTLLRNYRKRKKTDY